VAVEVGFEPTDGLPHHTLSRRAPSATRRLHRSRAYLRLTNSGGRATWGLTALVEELTKDRRALVCEHTADDLDRLPEARIMENVPDRAGRASPRIARAVHETRDARGQHGPGAHCARLQGHYQRAVIKPPVTTSLSGRTQGQHLSVGSGITAGLAQIPAAADDGPVPVNNHGTNRNVSRFSACRRSRFTQGREHRRLEAGYIARHRLTSRSGSTDSRVQSPLERSTEADTPGQACEHLVREKVQVTRQRT
jgi:hypothetical protein